MSFMTFYIYNIKTESWNESISNVEDSNMREEKRV